MNEIDIQKLAIGWVEHVKEFTKDENASTHAWAWDAEFDLKYDNPELLWELIQEINRIDQSSSVAEVLAAGPLEDLLAMHGEKFIELVEEKAKKDQSFAFLLGGVWQNDNYFPARVDQTISQPGPDHPDLHCA